MENGPVDKSDTSATSAGTGELSLSLSTLDASRSELASGDTVTLTVTPRDGAGKSFIPEGLTIAFSASGGGSTGTFGALKDNKNGTFETKFSGSIAGSPTTVTATLNGKPISKSLQLTVKPGLAAVSRSEVSVSPGTLAVGTSATVTLTTRDAAGNASQKGGFAVAFSLTGGTSAGTFGTVTDNGNGKYTTTFTATTAGTPATIRATLNNVAVTGPSAAVTVFQPGPDLGLSQVTLPGSTLFPGQTFLVTLVVKDSSGNAVDPGQAVSFQLEGTGSSAGTFGATSQVALGLYRSVFTAVTPGTPRSIRGYIGSSPLTSPAPSVQVVPRPNLQAEIEMGSGYASSGAPLTFWRSQTSLDTGDYDGSPVYTFEIVATNSEGTSRSVMLASSTGGTIATIAIGVSTTVPTRLSQTFTPNTGAEVYHLALDPGAFIVHSARILVNQTGATRTKLYIPLLAPASSFANSGDGGGLDKTDGTSSSSYVQPTTSVYSLWTKNAADYADLDGATPWTFEAVMNKFGGTDAYASLFNGNTQIADSELTTSFSAPTLVSAPLANNAANLTDGSDISVRIKGGGAMVIQKAGIWVKLTNLSKGEVYRRVLAGGAYTNAGASSQTMLYQRALVDLANYSSPSAFFESTASKSVTSGSTSLFYCPTDNSTDSGCLALDGAGTGSLTFTNDSYVRQRTPNIASSLATHDRYVVNVGAASSSAVSSSSSFLVVGFH